MNNGDLASASMDVVSPVYARYQLSIPQARPNKMFEQEQLLVWVFSFDHQSKLFRKLYLGWQVEPQKCCASVDGAIFSTARIRT